MNNSIRWWLGALATVSAATATAAQPVIVGDATSRVRVEFTAPDTYTDVRDRWGLPEASRDRLLEQLGAAIVTEASPRLAEGQRLVVKVRDVDMAGDAHPIGSSGALSPRVVRDTSPPRIELDFELVSAGGAVVKSGPRRLSQPFHLSRIPSTLREPLRHERALVADWLSAELSR